VPCSTLSINFAQALITRAFSTRAIIVFVIVLFVVAGFLLAPIFWIIWRGTSEAIHPPRAVPEPLPANFNRAAERVEFQSSDGVTLRGWLLPARNSARAIIFSHGYSGNSARDLNYAPLFHHAGYHQLYFDYRAHGASDGDTASFVYFERRDLLAAIDFLARRGLPRVGILGFSMGGAVAISTASLSPNVIAVATDCAFAQLELILGHAAGRRGVPRWLAPLVGWMIVAMASVRLRANLFATNPARWIQKIAPRPLLIMHGEADASVPVSEARALFRRAHEPKELWVVPRAGHRGIEEIAGEAYRERVIKFFDRAFQDLQGFENLAGLR